MGGKIVISSSHLDASFPVQEVINRLPAIDSPWLKDISDDGSVWTIEGGSGSKSDSAIIDFNWVFPDGSKLTDIKNSHYYEMACSYAWVYRLYRQSVSAKVHADRVGALITFFYWLRLMNVNSLASVTRDHIDLFAENIAFGKEWALNAPQRLHKHLKKLTNNGNDLPMELKQILKSKKLPLYQAAGIDWYGDGRTSVALKICSKLLDWLGTNSLENGELPPIEKILQDQGVELSPLTVQAVQRALMPIEELWAWRRQLPDVNLTFEPFALGSSKKAAQLGIEAKRHATIPPQLAISYLAGALTWVLTYSPIIIEEVAHDSNISVSRLNKRLNNAGLDIEVTEARHSSVRSRKVNVTRLVEVLSAACFAVIASLTARRVDEIIDLGSGCVERDYGGQFWLKTYIEKTSQRYDQIPIPIAAQRAIECMEEISHVPRARSDSDSIWQMIIDDIRKIKPQIYLDDLASLNKTLTIANTEWHFTAHQFRRFFAVLYFWRYEKGDLPALSHHLRHFDLEMTKRYVTDVQMGKIWKEVEAEWQGEFLRGVIDGSRNVGGMAGIRLKKEANKLLMHFRKSVDVVAPYRALMKLQRLANRLGSEFRQHVWGTICACPQSTRFAEHAKCKGAAKIGPVFRNANEDLCAVCPFAILTERFDEEAAKGLSSRKATASSCDDDTILSELAKMQVVSLEEILNNAQAIPLPPEEPHG